MSERYQIKAKIGQGGIGAVYRAFDSHLQRDVAVKRLLPPDESEAFEDDPTKTLFKEAHLLSALQHPNVVSVYDVGTDDDGVFVVMELVEGETFDQVVERGLLTEDDFAEMVAQTLEALIAAQDRNLVHRDIKPTNLMVKWLPSGKFQFKLLDFGLAKFSPRPTKQTIGLNDAILGSIHFMAPEQFERLPLDSRTDLYAMGCMYYYGLCGRYPFDGDTAAEVMASHLSHRVSPLHDFRPDVTKRTCDWVMWLMSRTMEDRPASAQEALEVFFNPEIVIPGRAAALGSRLIIPSGPPTPQFSRPQTGPQPSAAKGSGPVRLGSSPVRLGTSRYRTSPVRSGSGPAPVSASSDTSAIPTVFPVSAPGVPSAAAGHPVPGPAFRQAAPGIPAAPGVANARETHAVATAVPHRHHQKVKKWYQRKSVIFSAISVTLIIGISMLNMSGKSSRLKEIQRIQSFIESADDTGDARTVRELVNYLVPPTEVPNREDFIAATQYKLRDLRGDGVNEALIAALESSSGPTQERLINVVAWREMKEALPALGRAILADDPVNARRALEAVSVLGDSAQAETVATSMMESKHPGVRQLAEQTLSVLISRSSSKAGFVRPLERATRAGQSTEVRRAALRLIGQTGAAEAAQISAAIINSDEDELRIAAIEGLREWPDDSQLERLLALAGNDRSESVRQAAFETYVRNLVANQRIQRSKVDHQALWNRIAAIADNRQRKVVAISGLANVKEDFALPLIDQLAAGDDEGIRNLARDAKVQVEQAIRAGGPT